MTDEIRYPSHDGLTLFAKSYGAVDAAHTVLCLHGLTRNHKDFEPMIEALLPKHSDMRFVSWDTRGRCQSDYDPQPENYAVPTYAQDVISLLTHLETDRVTLIGTSMGGLISMALMSIIPKRIKGVVMNDIGPVIEVDGLRTIAGYLGKNDPVADIGKAAEAIKAKQASMFPDYTEEDWLNFARRTYRQRSDGLFEPDYDPAIVQNFAVPEELNENDDVLWGMYDGLASVPFLLIRGEISELLSEKTAQRMMDAHPNAKMATVPRTGHAPVLDEPEAVHAISQFLSAQKAI